MLARADQRLLPRRVEGEVRHAALLHRHTPQQFVRYPNIINAIHTANTTHSTTTNITNITKTNSTGGGRTPVKQVIKRQSAQLLLHRVH